MFPQTHAPPCERDGRQDAEANVVLCVCTLRLIGVITDAAKPRQAQPRACGHAREAPRFLGSAWRSRQVGGPTDPNSPACGRCSVGCLGRYSACGVA
eukprot:530739-Prymnesium_polylepis.1